MRRTPAYTLIALFTLALGIGATTAIFSVVNAALLRPLSYQDPARLVWIHDGMTPHDSQGWAACTADFLLWRNRARSFSALVAWGRDEFALSGEGDAGRLPGARVSAQFFDVLGIHPMRGQSYARAGQRGALVIAEMAHFYFARRSRIVDSKLRLAGRRSHRLLRSAGASPRHGGFS